MGTRAIFPQAPMRKGMYESFYLRAVAPTEATGVWIRHTVLKPPGRPPRGALWCTVFDARTPVPFQHKCAGLDVSAPSGEWITIGERANGDRQGASINAVHARGACGAAGWSLQARALDGELRHLPREWLYRAPLPRTKLESPAPAASFEGTMRLTGERELELEGWRGMVGHNWGSGHAERWIWLHGIGFEQAADAWIDVALGRVMVAGRMTPWVANGALALDGSRLRIGGLTPRGLRVAETPEGCALRLVGERGLTVNARLEVPAGSAAGWRYADPDGGAGHDVINCSIAAIELSVTLPGEHTRRALTSAHGGAYELGLRERDHGVPIASFEED